MRKTMLASLVGLLVPISASATSTSYGGSYLRRARNFDDTPLAVSIPQGDAAKRITNAGAADADQLDIVTAVADNELVIVAADVPRPELFQRASAADTRLVMLDAHSDPMTQIVAILAQHRELAAVHLVSHGQPGALTFGALRVDETSLRQRPEFLRALQDATRPGADFLLYGCDVAAGQEGESLLDLIAGQTQRDVAASFGPTGGRSGGGDWELEIRRGTIDASLPFSAKAMADFTGVLTGSYTLQDWTSSTPGTPAGCPGNAPTPYEYASLKSGNYVACGFMHNNGYGGTTVDLYNYFAGPTPAFLRMNGGPMVAQSTVSGTNHIDVRNDNSAFQLNQVVADEFAGTTTFSDVWITGYLAGGGTVTSGHVTSDSTAVSTFTFDSAD